MAPPMPLPLPPKTAEVSLEAKVQFLQSAAAYPHGQDSPERIETHMSWVFLVRDRVFKLKKPVRFPFLDFSTIEQREFYCREELRLNARLAPKVYLGMLALQSSAGGLLLVPDGQESAGAVTVDWLVLMRRLSRERMLAALLAGGAIEDRDIDALNAVLGMFYRRAVKPCVGPDEYVGRLQRELAASREVLLRPQFALHDAGRALDALDLALSARAAELRARAAGGHLVDGHGDLRPEHICLLATPVVIDCIEFNEALRQVDPFDEIAFLGLECAMAGAPWIGPRLAAGLTSALGEAPPPCVMSLYSAHRALLRARLSMAHLLDPVVRAPHRWPAQAQHYVDYALRALASV
jgi:aminoglycoside phosphotransferase family enzyme